MRILHFLLPQCCAVLCLLGSPVHEIWSHDIYTGRHFNSLIINSTNINGEMDDSIVATSAVLVIYDSTCLQKMKNERIDASSIPPAKHLAFAKYNYKEVEERVWYDLDDEDDLRDRYGYVECPDVIYLPKGTTIDRAVPWLQGEPFLNWIWGPFRKKIEVKNDLLDVIEVDVQGRGPVLPKVLINPGVYKTVNAYTSYTIMIRRQNTDKLLMYYVVEDTEDALDITVNKMAIKKFVKVTAEDWLNKINSKFTSEDEAVALHRKKMATMFALGLKQPLLVPKFTDIGYNMTAGVDKNIFTDLRKYFKDQSKNYVFADLEPIFNSDDVKVKQIKLESSIEEKIVNALKPTLEEWSSCKLTLSETTGIYVISRGTYIRPHTGQLNNHAISVLLMLDSDDEDWKLEIIDYTGNRVALPFPSGSSLVYESATIAHNSRTSFQGSVGTLLYLHFKPAHKWNWSVSGEHITNGVVKENIYQLGTETTKKEVRKVNIYNKWVQDVHDEL